MDIARRVGLVVNPSSGGGAAKGLGARLARRLAERGGEVVGLSALTAEVALANVRRELAGLDALVVVGGDGMVHLAIQALAESAIPLGIVPVGTGNDFAAAAGVPRDAARAGADVIERLTSRKPPRDVDLLRVTGAGVEGGVTGSDPVRWVAGAVSAGLDAAVNARANGMRFPRGSSRYVAAALREILAYRSWRYRVTADGLSTTPPQRAHLETFAGLHVNDTDLGAGHRLTWADSGALVTVANAPAFGGGIRVAPHARIDDGLLQLVLARDVGRFSAAQLFPLMVLGAHLRSPKLRAVTARAVAIESPDHPAVYGDGEPIGTTPVQIEVVRGALHLLR